MHLIALSPSAGLPLLSRKEIHPLRGKGVTEVQFLYPAHSGVAPPAVLAPDRQTGHEVSSSSGRPLAGSAWCVGVAGTRGATLLPSGGAPQSRTLPRSPSPASFSAPTGWLTPALALASFPAGGRKPSF